MNEDTGPWILWEGWVSWTTAHRQDDDTWRDRLHRDWCRILINGHGKLEFWQRLTWDVGGMAAKIDMCGWMPVAEVAEFDCLIVAEAALRDLFKQLRGGRFSAVVDDRELNNATARIAELEAELKASRLRITELEARLLHPAGAPAAPDKAAEAEFNPAVEINMQTIPGRILEYLHDHGPQLRIEIGRGINAATSSVSKHTRRLIQAGWLKQNEDITVGLAKPLECLSPPMPEAPAEANGSLPDFTMPGED